MAHGGKRENSGRKTKAVEIQEIENILPLQELLPLAIKKLKEKINGNDKALAFQASKLVIDKCVPDELKLKHGIDPQLKLLLEKANKLLPE